MPIRPAMFSLKDCLAFAFAAFVCWAGGRAPEAGAAEGCAGVLFTNAQVASEGIFLNQVAGGELAALRVRLGDAPAFGRLALLTRAQIQEALRERAPELALTNWTGANQVRVSRRARMLGEGELKELLTAQLQREQVRERGELELRVTRPWTAVSVPDEPLFVKFLDLPNAGVTPNFIARFELRTAHETLGNWQLPLQAKVWREVWVARAALTRGSVLREEDLERKQQDVLTMRDLLPERFEEGGTLELVENVAVGTPLQTRSARLKPIIRRGQVVEALLQDGGLTISLKVEVLENGIAGQVVRVRNPLSRREFRGKVQNEQTILVML